MYYKYFTHIFLRYWNLKLNYDKTRINSTLIESKGMTRIISIVSTELLINTWIVKIIKAWKMYNLQFLCEHYSMNICSTVELELR